MAKKIYLNLAVKDLVKSKKFFSSLGYTYNKHFTDDHALCLEISKEIYVMLLTEARFLQFTKKEIVDSKKSIQAIIAITLDSREAVDELVKKAVEAGGKLSRDAEDYGWMYGRSFEDLDGHIWESVYIDEENVPKK